MHHSVQEEWKFYTKQQELAKFHYKHFQWHFIEGARNVLSFALDKALPTKVFSLRSFQIFSFEK